MESLLGSGFGTNESCKETDGKGGEGSKIVQRTSWTRIQPHERSQPALQGCEVGLASPSELGEGGCASIPGVSPSPVIGHC